MSSPSITDPASNTNAAESKEASANNNNNSNNNPTSSAYQPATATNANTVLGLHGALRYPFAPMNLGWLHEYVSSLGSPDRYIGMCRILECLMANAVSTCDPFLEHAVVNFYTKFPAQFWVKVQTQQIGAGNNKHNNNNNNGGGNDAGETNNNESNVSTSSSDFELSRQVFEVIGLIRRFPNATSKSRKMLLTLVDRVLLDVTKQSSPALHQNRSIPEIVASVKDCVVKLRELHQFTQQSQPQQQQIQDATPTTEPTAKTAEEEIAHNAKIDESLQHLSSWLKYLFFALSSTRPVLVPACPPPPPGVQVIVPCSESCPCFANLKNKFPVYLSDVEKVKVIDSLLISGHGATAEEEMYAFARELLQRYTTEFCSRAVANLQNGQFAIARFFVFEALRLVRRSQSIVTRRGMADDARSLDIIEIALHKTQAACRGTLALSSVVTSLVPKALASLSRARNARSAILNSPVSALARQQAPTSPATAELYALQKHLTSIFQALCNQQFLLCVHYIPYHTSNINNTNSIASNAAGAESEKKSANSASSTVPPPPSASSQSPPPKPTTTGPPKCANVTCGTTKGDLLKCSACKVTWYCSRQCQQSDWKNHKPFCKKTAEERMQQQQGGSGFFSIHNNINGSGISGPTAAAALWLNEKCEKSVTGSEGVIEIRPIAFGF